MLVQYSKIYLKKPSWGGVLHEMLLVALLFIKLFNNHET